MERIKVAQYGIGHNHGSEKMKAFRRFPEYFEVVGVCEPDERWRKERGQLDAYEGLPWLTEEELFAIPGLQAVCVEPDVPALNRVARMCIDHGLHIHMDKPAGENLQEYKELLEEARRQKLVVQLGYMYRYNPVIQFCMEKVKNGELGEIFEIDSAMSTWHSPAYRQWLSQYKGGTMYIFGCHLIDLIIKMMGSPDKVHSYLRKVSPEEADAVDNGLAVLEYPKATCTVRIASQESNGYGRRQLVICGTKGTIEVKPLERPTKVTLAFHEQIKNHYSNTCEEVNIPITMDRYDQQIIDFGRMIRGEMENPFDYDHEYAVQRTTLQACGFEV